MPAPTGSMTEKASSPVVGSATATAAAMESVAGMAVVKLQMLTIPRSEHGFGFTLRMLPKTATDNRSTAVPHLGFDVAAVKPGSNAESAGLRPGDGIVSVDGVSVADRTLEQVVKQMQSCQGSIRLLVAPEVTRERNPAYEANPAAAEQDQEQPTKLTAQAAVGEAHLAPVTPSKDASAVTMAPSPSPSSYSAEVAASSPSGKTADGTSTDGSRGQQPLQHGAAAASAALPLSAEAELTEQPPKPQHADCQPSPVGAAADGQGVASPLSQRSPHMQTPCKTNSPRRPQLLFEWPPGGGSSSSGSSGSSSGTNGRGSDGPAGAKVFANKSAVAAAKATGGNLLELPKPGTAAVRQGGSRQSGSAVREMAAAIESLSPTRVASSAAPSFASSGAVAVEAPLAATIAVAAAEQEEQAGGSDSVGSSGYQLCAPRLPQRTLLAPVAVADSAALTPASPTDGVPRQVQPLMRPAADVSGPPAAVGGGSGSGVAASGGVRFLPAYTSPSVPTVTVENLSSRITWQRKYNPNSGGRAELDGGVSSRTMARPGMAVSAGQLALMPPGATTTVSRSDSVRPAGAPVVGRSSGRLLAAQQQPSQADTAGAVTASGNSPKAGSAAAGVVGRQQTVLGRRNSSGQHGGKQQQPQQQQQQQQQLVNEGGCSEQQQSQRAARLGHRAAFQSAPNIGTALAVAAVASADKLSDLDGGNSSSGVMATATVTASVQASTRQRLGSADDMLGNRGSGSSSSSNSAGCRGSLDRVVDDDVSYWPSADLPTSASSGSLYGSRTGVGKADAAMSSPDGSPQVVLRAAPVARPAAGGRRGSNGARLSPIDTGPAALSQPGAATAVEIVPPLSPTRSSAAAAPDTRASASSGRRSSAIDAAVLAPAQFYLQIYGSVDSSPGVAAAVAPPSAGSQIESSAAVLTPASDDVTRASLPSVSGGSAGGEDLHSIDSVHSGDSLDSGARKDSGSSVESLLTVPAADTVVLRRKSTVSDVDVRAQLARRTSYMIATSPGSDHNAEVPQSSVESSEGVHSSTTPRSHKSKLKNLFADKVHAIKETSERDQLTLLSLSTAPPTKEGSLMAKVERLDGKRSTERSWKLFTVSMYGHRLHFTRDRKEHSSSSLSLTPLALEEVPVDVRGCKVTLAVGYTKKKNTILLETQSGTELLLHAADIAEMMAWARVILTASAESEPGIEPPKVSALVDAAIRGMEQQLVNASRPSAASELARTQSARKPSSAGISFWARQHVAMGSAHSDRGYPSPSKKDRKPVGRQVKTDIEGDADARNGAEPARAFGIPLSECSPSHENEFVPLVVEQCTKAIEERGLEFEGLYRKPGNAAAVKTLRGELNRGIVDLENERWRDVNVVGSLLKEFFRKLPEPLVTAEKYSDFISSNHLHSHEAKLRRLKELVHSLPECNFETLKYLVRHLCKVASFGHVNKMAPRNLAICFGPTVIGCDTHSTKDTAMDMSDQCHIIESLILYSDWVFAVPAQDEPVPPVCEDQSMATPISETLVFVGSDLAGSGAKDTDSLASLSGAAQRALSRDGGNRARPSVSSEHSDGSFNERNIDAEVIARGGLLLPVPSPTESSSSSKTDESTGMPNSASAVVAAGEKAETPVVVSAVPEPASAAELAAAPPAALAFKVGAAASPRQRRAGQGGAAGVDSPMTPDAPPVIPARRHAVIMDGTGGVEQTTNPAAVAAAGVGGSASPDSVVVVVTAEVIASAEADLPPLTKAISRPPRPPRLKSVSSVPCDNSEEVAASTMPRGRGSDGSQAGAQSGSGAASGSSEAAETAPLLRSGAESGGKVPPLARSGSLDASVDSHCERSHRLSASLSSLDDVSSDLMHAITAELIDSDLKRFLHSANGAIPVCSLPSPLPKEPAAGRDSATGSSVDGSFQPGQMSAGVDASDMPSCASTAGRSAAAASNESNGRSASAAVHCSDGVTAVAASSVAAAPSSLASTSYRDPTLHKAGAPTQRPSAIAGSLAATGMVCERDRSSSGSGRIQARRGGGAASAAVTVDCPDGWEGSVAKREMTAERKHLRRRHTLGGGDHFEQFRESALAQSGTAQGSRTASAVHSKTSWELLQQHPTLSSTPPRHVIERTALSAFGWS